MFTMYFTKSFMASNLREIQLVTTVRELAAVPSVYLGILGLMRLVRHVGG